MKRDALLGGAVMALFAVMAIQETYVRAFEDAIKMNSMMMKHG